MTERQVEIEAILNKPIPEVVKLMDEQLLLSLWSVAFQAGIAIGRAMESQSLHNTLHKKPHLSN